MDDQRRAHARVDNEQRQRKVETARVWIFKHGKGVKSKYVEDLLQEDSSIPTRVSPKLCFLKSFLTIHSECLLNPTLPVRIQFLLNVRPGSPA